MIPRIRVLIGAVGPVAGRPDLWPTALRALAELVPVGWWKRPPFLPLPDRRWLRFRSVTAYGGTGREPLRADDVVTWLEWRRAWPG